MKGRRATSPHRSGSREAVAPGGASDCWVPWRCRRCYSPQSPERLSSERLRSLSRRSVRRSSLRLGPRLTPFERPSNSRRTRSACRWSTSPRPWIARGTLRTRCWQFAAISRWRRRRPTVATRRQTTDRGRVRGRAGFGLFGRHLLRAARGAPTPSGDRRLSSDAAAQRERHHGRSRPDVLAATPELVVPVVLIGQLRQCRPVRVHQRLRASIRRRPAGLGERRVARAGDFRRAGAARGRSAADVAIRDGLASAVTSSSDSLLLETLGPCSDAPAGRPEGRVERRACPRREPHLVPPFARHDVGVDSQDSLGRARRCRGYSLGARARVSLRIGRSAVPSTDGDPQRRRCLPSRPGRLVGVGARRGTLSSGLPRGRGLRPPHPRLAGPDRRSEQVLPRGCARSWRWACSCTA